MERTVKCWGCGNDEFTDEKHYYYKRPEPCCLKCGRFLGDKDGLLPFRGIRIERFDRSKKPLSSYTKCWL